MRPFDHVTFDMPFRRPDAQAIRSRIASIAYREGLKLPPNVIDQLVEGTGSDIRQIINMLSTFAVNRTDMTFDQGKSMYVPFIVTLIFIANIHNLGLNNGRNTLF